MARNATDESSGFLRGEFIDHHHSERNHQGKDNILLFPADAAIARGGRTVRCRERLGGLLRFYSRAA